MANISISLFTLLTLTMVLQGTSASDEKLKRNCSADFYHVPECEDFPDGYGCICGPGYVWNTHMCVARGLDSRLQFSNSTPARYTLLLNKRFRQLQNFTITMWLRLNNNTSTHPGTIMSYSTVDRRDIIRMTSGPKLQLFIHDQKIDTGLRINESTWTHVAWTWNSKDGASEWYIDGRRTGTDRHPASTQVVPSDGELVLGQAARNVETSKFDLRYAFLGDMAFVNIWQDVLSKKEITRVFQDCTLVTCGNAIEWADFRSGTRGEMKMRWPSQIFEKIPCATDQKLGETCDQHCSFVIGAQCNAGIVENVHWERTLAEQNISVPCPDSRANRNDTGLAHRVCLKTSTGDDGVWSEPNVDECASPQQLNFKLRAASLVNDDMANKTSILELAMQLANVTGTTTFSNPVDIDTVINTLGLIVSAQINAIPKGRGLSRQEDLPSEAYPSYNQTVHFAEASTQTLDNLIKLKNLRGWSATEPAGVEGDELVKVADRLFAALATSLRFHVRRGDIGQELAWLGSVHTHIAYNISIHSAISLDTEIFPNPKYTKTTSIENVRDRLTVSRDSVLDQNETEDSVVISLARYDFPEPVLPNHDIKRKSKEDKVNSAVLSLLVFTTDGQPLRNLSQPVPIKLTFLDNFNISNPECVVLRHGDSEERWRWSTEGCQLAANSTTGVQCHCNLTGVFAVTTDMYNVNWDRGDDPLILMAIPSYIGCSTSAALCLLSCLLLGYLRTSSKTTTIHKNFAVAISLSQLVFMFGIDRLENQMVCHGFAIALHYFFVSSFFWLMNEAFNLYIVITYAAHSHGEHTEGGSQWRYYILGWVVPGVLVGAFVGSHAQDYYAPDMCWIAYKYIWLFWGPVIGIISVIMLVLVFTAKEQYESSYAKNEKTNKMLVIHSKALWTQTILLILSWSFAFMSIWMRGIIVKVLYALFNSLQGSFFFVFYFLLNEEVRNMYHSSRKKKTLQKQGYGYSPTESDDGDYETNEMLERVPEVNSEPSTTRQRRKPDRKTARHRKVAKADIEVSSDEDGGEDGAGEEEEEEAGDEHTGMVKATNNDDGEDSDTQVMITTV